MLTKISILGSTGSIGTNTLDVVRSHPGRFKVVAMSCGRNLSLFVEQIREFKPKRVSVFREEDAVQLKQSLNGAVSEIFFGEEGAVQVAVHPEAEKVVSAMVGASGLVPTLRAIEAGKEIALANKETMVIAGELMTRAAEKAGVRIFPVDSEHSAIFQALQGHNSHEVKRIILTASGGPFLKTPKEELEKVTVGAALKHPNWSMGPKITIDSATLMNKGLEVIEARWLFQIPPEKIDVHVHPQSVVHSMVEYQDGSVIAQLGIPDMRIPIAYALSYPERLPNRLPSLDLFRIRDLNFFEPDEGRFESLKLARLALERGGDAPCVLNAANEIAVQCFLEEKIAFLEIPRLVGAVLEAHRVRTIDSLEKLLESDRWSRERAAALVHEIKTRSEKDRVFGRLSSSLHPNSIIPQ
jgi:1-deoxy-D-xylulose-5-phosphate reductoisomerase